MDFRNYISTLSLTQLREHLNILNSAILQKVSSASPRNLCVSSVSDHEYDITDYFEYKENFLNQTEIEALMAECLSLGFIRKTTKAVVQNRFISPFTEPYCWDSSNGPVRNEPISLDLYPGIRDTMNKINSEFGCRLNCSLVTFYKDGEVSARLHRDDEAELDQNQPIIVVSLGASRSVEFVDNRQESFRRNALAESPKEGSVYVMRAGCQQRFRHRVRMCKKIKDFRISLSFRAFIPPPDRPSQLIGVNASTAQASDCSFATPNSKVSNTSVAPALQNTSNSSVCSPIAEKLSPLVIKPLDELLTDHKPPPYPRGSTPFKLKPSPAPVSTEQLTKNSSVNLSAIRHPVDCGYSPFPSHVESSKLAPSAISSGPNNVNEKICVLFGTSITERVDPTLMSKGNRTVVNMSSSGANIDNIRQLASDFHYENPKSIHKIDKIIISVGTNDVKWFNCYAKDMKRELKPKLVKLVQELKQLYPSAHISFHTVLPIKIVYKYTAASIHQFNNLLLEVCTQNGCTFFDCFARFLDRQGVFYNSSLFRDNWHLNDIGLKVLCRALKFMVYGNLFNPLPRYSCYSRFYPF